MQTVVHLMEMTVLVALVLTVSGIMLVRHAVRRLRRRLRALTAANRVHGHVAQVRRLHPEDPVLSSRLRRPTLDPPMARTPGPVLVARASLPGPGRDVAVVRRDLLRDITGATHAVAAGRKAGRPVDELECSVRRLAEQAHALDVDLQVIAAEPDRAARRRLLAAHAERSDLIRRTCAQARMAVLVMGSAANEPVLNSIVNDINDQVSALDLRARAYQELSSLHG